MPYIFGRTATAGAVVAKNIYAGATANHFQTVQVLSIGPIEGVDEVFANEVSTTFTSRNANGYYHNFMWFDWKAGNPTEAAHTISTAPYPHDPPPEWTVDHKLSGLASYQLIMRANHILYSTGPAAPLVVVKGPPAYDPRQDSTVPGGSGTQEAGDRTTWGYSGNDNPFLAALSWSLGITDAGEIVMGAGMPPEGIDLDAFIDGANVCEDNGWTCGGVALSTDAKYTVLEQLLRAGGGRPIPMGGKLSVMVQAPRVSLATLTGADLWGDASITGTPGFKDRFNTVVPRYRAEDRDWEVIAADPTSVEDFVTEDGGKRTKEIGYAYVQDKDQAAQLARYDIWDSREAGPFEFEVRPRWRHLRPGNCFTFHEPELGVDEPIKLMIRERTRNPMTGRVVLRCWTETDAKHADALGTTGTLPAPGSGPVPEPGIDPPDTGSWSAGGGTIVGGGAEFPAIVVTGASDRAEAANLLVRYRPVGATDWLTVSSPATVSTVYLPAVGAISDYEVEYAYESIRGIESTTWTPDAAGTVTTGALVPMDLSVTTEKIVDENVTIAEQQTRFSGFGGAGQIFVPYEGAGHNVFTQLDEYVFDYVGEGSTQIEWQGKVEWQSNATTWLKFFVSLDETPTYAFGTYSGFQGDIVIYQGNSDALSTLVVLPITLSGLTVGSHTLSIWAQTYQNTLYVPYLDVGATFKEFVSKK